MAVTFRNCSSATWSRRATGDRRLEAFDRQLDVPRHQVQRRADLVRHRRRGFADRGELLAAAQFLAQLEHLLVHVQQLAVARADLLRGLGDALLQAAVQLPHSASI